MKGKSSSSMWLLFRYLVVPALFSCSIFKHPVTQWIAIGVFAIWLACLVVGGASKWIKGRVRKAKVKKPATVVEPKKVEAASVGMTEDSVFLIRQINYRITEQLIHVYPDVSWLWVRRPEVEEFRAGGAWKIRLDNCGSYNFAEVRLLPSGKMDLTLIHAVSLAGETAAKPKPAPEPEDLTESETLDRTDAKTWYTEYGAEKLAGIIDGLNPLGHKKLTIHEDGEVFIQNGAREVAVDKLEWMLPKIGWKDLCILFQEDEIQAEANEQSLVLAW